HPVAAMAVCRGSPASHECLAVSIRSPIPGYTSRRHPRYRRSLTRAFQILDWRRVRSLDVAVIFLVKSTGVVKMRPLASALIQAAAHLAVEACARAWEQRHVFE